MQTSEPEQKLKLSTSNIIALGSFLFAIIAGYVQLTSEIAKQNLQITTIEKTLDESKSDKGKIEFKLDKLIETTNQIKVDMASKIPSQYEH